MAAERAATYDELKEAISREYPRLSRQLQAIARFALERPHDLALNTVAALAGEIAVQPSSLIRFANALGFAGFSQMQRLFRSHLVERSTRSASYRERIASLRARAKDGGTAPPEVLHGFVADSIHGLEKLEEGIRPADLRAAVRLLAAAQTIYLIGLRRSFPVAAYLAYALNQLELRTQLLDGAGGMNREFARLVGRKDVLVAVSFRNYTPEAVDITAGCHARGVPVIAITDSPLSPIARAAAVAFELGDDSNRLFRSLVEPLCLAQSLVVSVGHHLAERNGAPRRETQAREAVR
jgi:DNA-binding MurR/RpiR family transcriptional regulator